MGTELTEVIASALQGIIAGDEPAGPMNDAEEKQREEKVVKLLFKRISQAKKTKEKWEQNYEVDRSHDYVRGFQRDQDDEKDAQGDRRYQINKILSALKAKIPKIFYYHPYIRIRPSRSREDAPGGTINQRAQLLQDTVNSIIQQKDTRFKPECLSALKESHWAFGVVEVGYEADWVENPFKRKPRLVENEDVERDMVEAGAIPDPDSPMAAFADLDQVPSYESFYVKHIPAKNFFVSSNDRTDTLSMDWVGYWEWMFVNDVKKAYDNTEDLEATGKETIGEAGTDKELAPHYSVNEEIPPDMVRVWKVWDLREKLRYVIAEGHDRILKETDFDYLPVYDIRLEVMPGEWYPVPPVYQQLTEQDEFNDGREFLRLVRKGTRPRFAYDKHAFTQDELEKLENDEFGVFIGVDNTNMQPIQPIQQPTFAEAALRTLTLADTGFSEQAASSPQARLTRGSGGAPTATEVQELSQMGDVRDSYEQQEVADWLSDVAAGLLSCAIERMTLPQWVLINTDPHSQAVAMDAMQISTYLNQIKNPIPPEVEKIAMSMHQQERQLVSQADLSAAYGDGRWDVTVDIESMSPVSESQHAARIMQAMNLIASPGVGQLLSLSPPLLKTMLNMMGIRNAADQNAIQMALMMRDQMNMLMMQMGGGGAPGVAPMPGGDQPNAGAGAAGPPPPEAPDVKKETPGGPQ